MPSKNYSVKTCEEYARDVSQFVEWLDSQGIHYADEVGFEHLSAFTKQHQQDGLKASTRARKIFSIKVYFSYLEGYGYIGRNPANQLVAPDVERFPARPASIAEFEKKLSAISNPRDRTMLLLQATTQIRQKELVALTLDDVELLAEATIGEANAGDITVTRSSGRYRFPIDYRCWLALKQWLVERQRIVEEKAITERSVFLNRFGQQISARYCRYMSICGQCLLSAAQEESAL